MDNALNVPSFSMMLKEEEYVAEYGAGYVAEYVADFLDQAWTRGGRALAAALLS